MELIVRRRYPRGLSRPKDETSAEGNSPAGLDSVHSVQAPRLASHGQDGSPGSDPPIAGLGAVRARKAPRWRRAAWLASVVVGTLGCGHSSEPTGPDVVPNAERKEHRVIQTGRLTEPQRPTPMTIAEIINLQRFPQAYTRAQLDEITAIESRGVVVVAYLARLLQMGAGSLPRERYAQPAHHRADARHSVSQAQLYVGGVGASLWGGDADPPDWLVVLRLTPPG